MVRLKIRQGNGDLLLLFFLLGRLLLLLQFGQFLGLLFRQRPFRHGDNAEIFSPMATAADGLGHLIDLVGDLGNKDHVRTAGQTGSQPQPTGIMPHDLHNNDAMVAMGGGVQPVNGIGGDRQGSVKAKVV